MNGFSFYQPEYLWGLVFLGAIALIHFLKRNASRKLEFSTLRFFKISAVRASRIRKLKRVLLFVNRCAIAALIVFIFAGPYSGKDPASILRNPRVSVYTWIDPTMSMNYVNKGRSIFGTALKLEDSLLTVLPVSARCFFYDEVQKEFVPSVSLTKQEHACRYGPSGISDMFAAFVRQSKNSSTPVLVCFSDFQKSSGEAIDTFILNGQTALPVLFVSLTPWAPWNYSVDGTTDAVNAGGVKAVIRAARRGLDQGVLEAEVNGMRIGHKVLSCKAGDSAVVNIDIAQDLGSTPGKLILSGDDPLAFDNEDWFCRDTPDRNRVLIAGDPAANMVLSAALKASGKFWDPIVIKDGDRITIDDIDSSSLIIINQLSHPSRALESFASGSIPGEKAVVFALSTEEPGLSWSNSCVIRLFPAMTLLKPYSSNTPHMPVLPDTVSILWQGFRFLRSSEIGVYSYFDTLPGEPLLSLENGRSLMTRFRDKGGRTWMLLSTSLGITSANNLCESGFYVPFIDRIARHALSFVKSGSMRMTAGYPGANPYIGTGKGAAVFSMENILLKRWEHQASVLFEKPGIYRIAPDGEASYTILVKGDPAERELIYKQVKLPLDGKKRMKVFTEQQFRDFLDNSRHSKHTGIWIVLLLLVFSEILLWNKPRTR